MNAIIKGQGKQTQHFGPGPLVHEVCASQDGVVSGIDNYQLARIARLAGAPLDKGAGVDLNKRLGDAVTRGEPLYRIHAQFSADFQFARTMAEQNSGYRVGSGADIPQLSVEF